MSWLPALADLPPDCWRQLRGVLRLIGWVLTVVLPGYLVWFIVQASRS